jgi:SAM-dependent methyltransferase
MTQVEQTPAAQRDTVPDTRNAADQELKAKHRSMWALGDYPAVATEVIAGLGPVLVEAAGISSGDTVLDVAAGSGNVAIPAARTGARVVASDLTPALLEAGRRRADVAGVQLDWEEGDAEALPYQDGQFDTVLSCVGVMFAPHHQAAADELVRVCRPGGTIALVAWTPSGFIGQMFATMKPYAPPPPPGVQPPPLWGDEAHVRSLLGDRVESVTAETRTLPVDRFDTPESFRDFFKACYGPTIAAYRNLASDPDRTAALDRALVDLAGRFGLGSGTSVMEWEYLLVTARRV